MHWGLMYKKENTPEEIYAEYFDDVTDLNDDYEINKKKTLILK
jgi:hypothetical protein